MRGEIEIWQGDKVIFSDNNMLTDGAGSILADIMTISPSYSEIPDLSSLLDASNFTIQAMSFGTAPQSYASGTTNARITNGVVRSAVEDLLETQVSSNNYSSVALYIDKEFESGKVDYPVSNYTPTAPDPQLSVLELSTDVTNDPNPSGGFFFSLSALGPSPGQHQNYHPVFIKEGILPISKNFLNSQLAAAFAGTYPPGASETGTEGIMLLTFSSIEEGDSNELSLTAGSYANEASSIDTDGFISVVSGTNTQNGVTVSSNASFASNGTVEYALTLSKDDLACLHFYGGVYHMGLWALDLKASLTEGNTPPFAFSALDNPRKYRLFCRKGLSKDLTYIDDITQYQDMTIKWRLRFL